MKKGKPKDKVIEIVCQGRVLHRVYPRVRRGWGVNLPARIVVGTMVMLDKPEPIKPRPKAKYD